jgi:lysophospholipase L1-like esterase
MTMRRGPLAVLLLAGSAAVLSHRSAEGAVLGRYSMAYAVHALTFLAASALFWRCLRPGSGSLRVLEQLAATTSLKVTLACLGIGLAQLTAAAAQVSLSLAGHVLAGASAILMLTATWAATFVKPAGVGSFAEALSRAAMVSVGLLSALAAGEGAVRLFWGVPLPLHRDAYPELYRLNSLGFRDREWAPRKPAGTRRILALGDSVTFGWGVPLERTYARVLERSLQAADASTRWEVLSVARPGANTAEEVRLLETAGLRLDPDVVLLGFVLNDPEATAAPTASGRSPLPGWRSVLRRSRLGLMLEWALFGRSLPARADYERYVVSLFDPASAGWKACVDALGRLERLRQERGFRLVVVVFPLPVASSPYPYVPQHRQIAATCSGLGLPVLDLQEEFEREGLDPASLDVGDGHPSALGHERAAAAILRFLERQGLVGPRAAGRSAG